MCERTTDSTDDVSYAFAHQLTHLCYEHYKTRLSKNGKPQKNCEWTLLAAVVQSVHSEKGIIITIPLSFYLFSALDLNASMGLHFRPISVTYANSLTPC